MDSTQAGKGPAGVVTQAQMNESMHGAGVAGYLRASYLCKRAKSWWP